MKILKIFGVVVGIHVFALIVIFANPGCSSSMKPTPAPADTVVAPTDTSSPKIVVPSNAAAATENSPVVSAPLNASETSPLVAAPVSGDANSAAIVGLRFSPTRPGTAAAETLEVKPAADVTPATTYVVGKGDSLWTIAKKNHLSISDLAAANNIKAGAPVRVGQKLLIPAKAVSGLTSAVEPVKAHSAPSSSAAATKATGDTVHHVVKSGESLGAIARKYQVRVGDIATANNITDPARIRPGMELVIPGWQTPPTGKTADKAVKKGASTVAPVAIPAIAVPRADQDLDTGLKPSSSSPPVIQIEDTSAPKKS